MEESVPLLSFLTLGLVSKTLPTFMVLGAYCTYIYEIIFSTFFFNVRCIDSIEVQMLLLFRFFISNATV